MIEPDSERLDDTPPATFADLAAKWKRRLVNCGPGLTPELRGDTPPKFDCPYCCDALFLPFPRRRPVLGASDTTTWFCRCPRGMTAEAGWWFAKIYPADHAGRRHLNSTGKELFEKYQAEHYRHANLLQPRIDELRQRYERERTRKLESQESAA
jgi:hypothetical protein